VLEFDKLQNLRFAVCFLFFLYLATYAQKTDGNSVKKNHTPLIDLNQKVTFEVSPHSGFMGSSGIFGLKLSMNYKSLGFELAGEQVIGNTANLYPVSVNAIINLSTRGRAIPYGVIGAGLFLTVPNNTLGDETVSSIGMNFGGGLRYYLNRTLGLRFEAKQYVTNIKGESDLNNELLIFQELSFGITFMFK
jgi:hypothetical protein